MKRGFLHLSGCIRSRSTRVLSLPRRTCTWNLVENGKSGGKFKAGPDVDHSGVSYLYAGYENGSLLGSDAVAAGAYYGQTRSYLKINYDFQGKLPEDAIITAALKGYKYAGKVPSGTKVYCKMVNDNWKSSQTDVAYAARLLQYHFQRSGCICKGLEDL